MKRFPIMLDLAGRRVVVVGMGAVGLRKIRVLVEAGANVTAVDPQAPTIANVQVIRGPYDPSCIEGATLVFACTGDRGLNSRVCADARAMGALANAADQPEDCDFHMPAIIDAEPVVVAIGTSGAAPALAGELKKRIAANLPEHLGALATALEQLRDQLRRDMPDEKRRMNIMRKLCAEAIDIYQPGQPETLRDRMNELIRKHQDGQ